MMGSIICNLHPGCFSQHPSVVGFFRRIYSLDDTFLDIEPKLERPSPASISTLLTPDSDSFLPLMHFHLKGQSHPETLGEIVGCCLL